MRLFIYLSIFGVLHNGFAIPIPSGPQSTHIGPSGDPPSQPPSQAGPSKPKWKRNPRKHKCDVKDCPQAFDSSTTLQRHVDAVHLNNKRFRCEIADCDAKFARADALKRHKQNVHNLNLNPGASGNTDPRGFYCEFCYKWIKRKDHFAEHLLKKTHLEAVERKNLWQQTQPHHGNQPLPHPDPGHQPQPQQAALLHPPLGPSPHQPGSHPSWGPG